MIPPDRVIGGWLRLHSWNRAWKDIELDPTTGRARSVRLARPRDHGLTPIGFAHFERRLFGARICFALYRVGDHLFFSAGARRWRLDEAGLRFTHRTVSPVLSRFTVEVDDGVTDFSITYSHVRRLAFQVIDPTYDGIDHETDFFLDFVARYADTPEWQATALERWLPAPES